MNIEYYGKNENSKLSNKLRLKVQFSAEVGYILQVVKRRSNGGIFMSSSIGVGAFTVVSASFLHLFFQSHRDLIISKR